MAYISKYDRTFLSYMNNKYQHYKVNFEYFDDYILWLYYDHYKKDETKYYKQLEKDLWKYVEFQSGRERDRRGKIGGWINEKK